MSEYWKSNPRKFCDFCKCWIADNKPSVEFHERGKRHKENVQTKLEEIGKKGQEDYENKLKEDDYMREMEEAALKAYKKDIELNPDFTATRISELAQASNATIVITKKEDMKKQTDSTQVLKKSKEQVIPKSIETKNQKPKKWKEAKTPEGFSYYWNTESGETVWEAPKEGFIGLEEPKPKQKKKKMSDSTISKSKEPHPSSNQTFGPILKVNPYGKWESTFQPEPLQIDLQLPSLPEQEYYAPEVIIDKPDVKFTEKVVTLSKDSFNGPVSFKKRKGGDEHKKNVRRRIED